MVISRVAEFQWLAGAFFGFFGWIFRANFLPHFNVSAHQSGVRVARQIWPSVFTSLRHFGTKQMVQVTSTQCDVTLSALVQITLNRFLPTILLALSLTTAGLYDHSPHTIKTRNMCLSNCQKYWWYTPMQISYLLDFNRIVLHFFNFAFLGALWSCFSSARQGCGTCQSIRCTMF